MQQNSARVVNGVLLRGASLWIMVALILAWCLVGLGFHVPLLGYIFPGEFHRVLQAHIDFLLMSALILGFYGARVPLPWHVRWAMVVGAFTNSSLFLFMAIFPALDPNGGGKPAQGFFPSLFLVYQFASLLTTSYGFGKGAVTVLRATLGDREGRPSSQ